MGCFALLLWSTPLAGQGADTLTGVAAAPGSASWRPVLESALVPGWGQLDLGQTRGWLYLAVEAAVWTGYGVSRHAGLDDRRAYRDLAWREARDEIQPRRDGDFEYYERVGAWTRSGAFDLDPGAPGVQPEVDATTFNGDAWALAQDLVGLPPGAGPEHPGYERALELYRERAYPEDLVWDWSASPEARTQYRSLVRESDQHLRRSTIILGGVFLNHVVSGLDAYLSQAADTRVQVGVAPGRAPHFDPFLTLRVFHP